MKRTGLFFRWESGSKNSNAIAVLKKKGIRFQYSHFGDLIADFYGLGIWQPVEYAKISGDTFEICAGEV